MISEHPAINTRYCNSLTEYSRRPTIEVTIGDVPMGAHHPIRVQSMTTVDTMDTLGSVEQTIRMVEAGCEYVRITAPSVKEAQNLENIRKELRKRGYTVPLIADIHFTPNAAELVARLVEKVRINPGNYADRKRFETIDYTDASYQAELERIRERFLPLVNICKEYGTAMRIGTNHGSLSDRILSRYGDTPLGMVESALEFLRICEDMHYYNIVLSMKASNTQVMVQAYRLLAQKLDEEGLKPYPLHLGVTEAGEAEDGRIKSAVGIGTLLEDGLGDTVRVSLTEEPEKEAPVARTLIDRYTNRIKEIAPACPTGRDWGLEDGGQRLEVKSQQSAVGGWKLENGNQNSEKENQSLPDRQAGALRNPSLSDRQTQSASPINPFQYCRRQTREILNIGASNVPRVIADFSNLADVQIEDLKSIGHFYLPVPDKWKMNDLGADFIYTGDHKIAFMLPNGLKEIVNYAVWQQVDDQTHTFPWLSAEEYVSVAIRHAQLNFVHLTVQNLSTELLHQLRDDQTAVAVLSTDNAHAMPELRQLFFELIRQQITAPVIIWRQYGNLAEDTFLLYAATDCGGLLIDGLGDGVMLSREIPTTDKPALLRQLSVSNQTAFGILQAARTRMSKTEYISCPSCGRTLFDLQETTATIRKRTDHLKGVKIGIMGCIVNGPGEMADADYGYVGVGRGKIALYRGQNVVKKSVPAANAVDELIELIREDGNWLEPEAVVNA